MKTSSILDTYQTWLTHREYSPRHHPEVHQSPGPLFCRYRGRGHPDPRDRCSLAG